MAEQINDLVIPRALRNVAGQSGMTPQQVRRNIEKMLEYEHKDGQTTTRADGCFEITFQA